MRRRDVIGLAGAAVVLRSLPARAQRPDMKLVGIVSATGEPEMVPLRTALARRLQELGWTENENIRFDIRLFRNSLVLAEAVSDLSQRRPDVILVQGTPALLALRKVTDIPVVFMLVADPVGQGLIKSLANPGGSITGVTNFEISVGGKWVELLKQLNAGIDRLLVLANPGNPTSGKFAEQIARAGGLMNIAVTTTEVHNAAQIEAAMRSFGASPNGAMLTLPDFLPLANRDLIIRTAEEMRMPSIHPFRTFTATGGLMSYGLDFPEVYKQAAGYVDQILRGASPANLPVRAPNKFELVIKHKTARAFGIDIPASLLAQADEVID